MLVTALSPVVRGHPNSLYRAYVLVQVIDDVTNGGIPLQAWIPSMFCHQLESRGRYAIPLGSPLSAHSNRLFYVAGITGRGHLFLRRKGAQVVLRPDQCALFDHGEDICWLVAQRTSHMARCQQAGDAHAMWLSRIVCEQHT